MLRTNANAWLCEWKMFQAKVRTNSSHFLVWNSTDKGRSRLARKWQWPVLRFFSLSKWWLPKRWINVTVSLLTSAESRFLSYRSRVTKPFAMVPLIMSLGKSHYLLPELRSYCLKWDVITRARDVPNVFTAFHSSLNVKNFPVFEKSKQDLVVADCMEVMI